MNATEYIRRQIAGARRVSDGVTSDLTDEMLNWTPPGTANPISAILAHVISGEDRFIQTVIQGKPTLWETQNWAEKMGVSVAPRRGANWEEYRGRKLSLGPFKAYEDAVRAATDAYLDTLTEEELDRKVIFNNEERLVGDMLALLVTHATQHAGEIAALKGIQGAKGLPY